MKFKQILLIIAISAASAVGSVALYNKFTATQPVVIGSGEKGLPVNYAGFFDGKTGSPAEGMDFTKAANAAVPAVVHIKTKIPAQKVSNNLGRNSNRGFDDLFDQLFGEGGFGPNIIPEQRASGSGVIISEDGYIVTNNHVISAQGGGIASEITVTLSNRKTFKARVIGRDPSSDIAVLKIDATKLPFLVYGNSDNVLLGQWVLAIGYPLTLDATVTAGIVSATGRSIGINSRQTQRGDTPVESFIQTDAAVNQGNSGGALVNTNGELIGINSAILAPSGTYAGYSFAIPVTIIKKIVNDIIQYGDVQRGYLGVSYAPTDDLSEDQIKSLGIPTNLTGVYVSSVSSEGGAAAAGIKKGDVITRVNNATVTSGVQMSAQIAGFRPGDKVPVTYNRGGKEFTVNVILKKKSDVINNNIGTRLKADLSTLSSDKAARYGIEGGVVVNKIFDDSPLSRARIQPGFIIISVGGQEINSIEELTELLMNMSGTVKVEGIYPGNDMPYSYPVNLDQ
ncbi:MAG TPA: trypsin-like peptidase domain-containing protein [Flavisolibacter sp.]|jgi:Do/DeqQ family serine protease|nr:trypsin-like peptidase domain-containing protein [Flavisolibacter sp.]